MQLSAVLQNVADSVGSEINFEQTSEYAEFAAARDLIQLAVNKTLI